jgi:transcriptional regulator with XRE-family HTH domain
VAKSKTVLSKEDFGGRIRALRMQKGMTQVDLGKKLGMPQSNVSELERGVRGLTVRQLLKLSTILSVSTDEILLGHATSTNGRRALSLKVLRRAQRIQELAPAKQRALLELLDAFLDKRSHS